MQRIKLQYPFSFHHAEIPEGTVIEVPRGLALTLVQRQTAIMMEPEKTIIEQPEVRIKNYPPIDPIEDIEPPIIRRGRKRKNG